MGKLHELLAVESDVKGLQKKINSETEKAFEDKNKYFEGKVKTYVAFDSNDKDCPETEKKFPVYTVKEKIAYHLDHFQKLVDVIHQQETTNTLAKADVILVDEDGNEETLLTNVPVVSLLNLERELGELRRVMGKTPTLDPAMNWDKDSSTENWFKTTPISRTRKRNQKKAIVLYPATDKHPAQTQLIDEDIPVGVFSEEFISSCITPTEKSSFLSKLDKLIVGVKKARARANQADASTDKIGLKITNFLKK